MNFIFTLPSTFCAIQAEVPAGITDKDNLLLALYEALNFPDYFGMNWDALDECMGDLSWLPAGHVHLTHHDVPLIDKKRELHIYLSCLDDAIRKWETESSNLTFNRKLIVSFPMKYFDVISEAL